MARDDTSSIRCSAASAHRSTTTTSWSSWRRRPGRGSRPRASPTTRRPRRSRCATPWTGARGDAYLVRDPDGPQPAEPAYAVFDPARGEVRAQSYRLQYPPGRNFFTRLDRKSTRLNSSHVEISYAVFCLKKKKK